MPPRRSLNIKKAIEQGAERTTLSQLADRGVRNVKVLDEKALLELIRNAVDESISTGTEEERARIAADSRKHLNRLMQERNEFMSQAETHQAGQAELSAQIEKLQDELKLRREIERQGEEGFKAQLKELVDRRRGVDDAVGTLQSENESLKQENEEFRESNEAFKQDSEAVRQENEELRAENASLREQLEAAEQEILRLQAEIDRLRAGTEEATADRDRIEQELNDALQEIDRLGKEIEGLKAAPLISIDDGNEEGGTRARKRATAEPPVQVAEVAPPPEPEGPPPLAGRVKLDEGKGLDIGTVNLVAAEQDAEGEVSIRVQRNAFVDLEIDLPMKRRLTQMGVPYVIQDDKMYVLGEHAFELANVLSRNCRRPMKDGLISSEEQDALPVMKLLIDTILGPPRVTHEACFYSVPGDPVDSDMSVVYHQDLFDAALKALGYLPRHIVEGHAVTFAELGADDFTGIGVSCGGGMFNICVTYKSMPALRFSTSKSGDWVDQSVADAMGMRPNNVTILKEKGIDLVNPRSREEEAIAIYYRELIEYNLHQIKLRFLNSPDMPTFPEPVSMVFSGGTSLAGGFIDLAREVFAGLEFPIPVKELRLSEDPLNSTAKGCLTAAMLESAQEEAGS